MTGVGGDKRLGLFQGYGIELEYMIVDRTTLSVKPVCDELLRAVAGEYVGDVDDGPIGWSNELALHVVELKTNGAAPSLRELPGAFQRSLRRVDALLEPLGARLLPTGMHPWMDPRRELRLWPHDNDVVYATFDRIFGCTGHGWSNLQSMHLNLSFGEDQSPDGEFARLHAAVRVVLPLLPALAASSPLFEGRVSGLSDTRLDFYRTNARRIPSVSGRVVPEAVFTRPDYEREILERIYSDMAPHDPEGVVRHEWSNARGAIARFDRSAIEIRVIDVQECPRADLAIAELTTAVLKALVSERWSGLDRQKGAPLEQLVAQLDRCIADGERAAVSDVDYLALLGLEGDGWTAGTVWRHLADELLPPSSPFREAYGDALDTILEEGPLARRILTALGSDRSHARLHAVYTRLAACLLEDQLFHATRASRRRGSDPAGSMQPALGGDVTPGGRGLGMAAGRVPRRPAHDSARRTRLTEVLLVTCEHGGQRVPPSCSRLFRSARRLLASHHGWDPGALQLARQLARHLDAPLVASTVSRLVVDLNRSQGHPRLFSERTRALDAKARHLLLVRHYYPHRTRVLDELARAHARSRRVVHVAVHSFTPIHDGVPRRADIGLLYDPKRSEESGLARAWSRSIRRADPTLRVLANHPYRGDSDGLTTSLRRLHPQARYLGLELEVSQALVGAGPGRWRALRALLVDTLGEVLAQRRS